MLLVLSALAGCGSGGYAGGGIASLSASAVTIDAGQSFSVTSTAGAGIPVGWALSGVACSGNACGTLSQDAGLSTVYTAPPGLAAPLKVTLTASVAGTASRQTVSITVNPDPAISGTPPAGVVGVAYSATLVASGGTAPLKWSQASGTLPAGLSFNSSTGVISGTPTAAGTSTFVAQVVDSSAVPFTVSANETITITNAGSTGTLSISGNPPGGVVGATYATTLAAAGGIAPYSFAVVSGALPTGLGLSASTGAITGVPTTAGIFSFTAQVQDASGLKATSIFSITIANAAGTLTLTTSTLPNGTVGVPYSATIGVSGGTPPYNCVFTAGTLPAGLTLNGCVVSGTPTVAVVSNLTVKATDASSPAASVTGPEAITINAAASLVIGSPVGGTVGVPYNAPIPVSGGTAPYTCVLTSGTLPAGLTLSGCVVTGTPTMAGTSNITIKATDSGNPATVTSGPVSIVIAPAPLAITTGTLPNGTVGIVYSSTIGVTGGTAPYICTITSGTLPAGLALGANCLVSGTPTTAGTSNLTVKAVDSGNPALSTSGPVSITIVGAPVLTITSPPNGTVGTVYTGSIPVAGGTGPYTCTISAGTLPAGLALGAGCAITGTPTAAGTATLTVKATDSKAPPTTSTGTVSLTINPAPLAITTGTLPNGTVGVVYSSTIGVSGGTAPYTCTITSGTLPAGLALGANCLVSGTPTVATTANLMVKATDTSNPTLTTTGPVSITINPAPLAITTGTLPNGTVGVVYSSTIGVSGGTAPYTCTITSGTLPAGLALGANCLVSGTPTVATTANLTVKATDTSNPTLTTTGPVSITINPAPLTLTIGNPPVGTVGIMYMGTIPVTGGTGPYTCILIKGTLPGGLTLNNCILTGTPISGGTGTITVGVTDSSNPPVTGNGPVTITINTPTPVIALGNPPPATVGTPYTGVIPVTGGTAPYTCTLNSGTVPAGLTLTNCTLTGTPTTAVTSTLNITATDSSNPQGTTTGPVVVTVNPVAKLAFTGSLPNAILGVPYTQTLTATGGIAPYTYAVTAGSLPPGLTLNQATGVISGTPTAVGASSFTDTATDTETTPQTAPLPLVILVTYPTTATDGELKGPYAFLFQGYDDVAAGLFAYQTATAGSFTADGTGVVSNGELDANHQGSNPAGATVTSNLFLGTYTLGADNRGSLTLTTLNADGTTAQTSTYAISVKAPVAPATTTAQGSLIEFDNNQLRGTKGSGTLLQQTAASFATGLTGSYAFGLSGDTPCLPTCTIGVVAGPVASVGQFTVGSGAITNGSSDANIANVKFTNQGLSGTYGTADGNGRVQLSLATAGTPAGIYPTDYAVYMVSANQAFLVSTDKHSAAILLAGSAQSQTLTSYANSSLSGPFIGYENAATNPGLVGATLANTLNLSTATIFRATGDGAGTCSVTNVDTGGTTQLVNGLTGLGSGAPLINALLGTYQSTGAAACGVSTNGRGILNYPVPDTALTAALALLGINAVPPPARVVYLAGADRGYFLETGYAGLGQIEPQTGAPFLSTSFNGTYVYGQAPASSVATTNASGFITAHGDGTATSTEDLNVGVGTLNVLELGVTHNDTYTTPDRTTGRFVLNDTTVIDASAVYFVSPGRYVLLDTNPATTSPAVTVLY